MWQPKHQGAEIAEHSNKSSDFLTSEEERGLIQKSFWPRVAIGIVFIAVLLLFFVLNGS